MHTLLVSLHIILMIISLIVTIGSVIMTARGRTVRTEIMRSNLIITITGLGAGAILLFTAPLGVRCLVLSAYLVAFGLAYRYMSRAQATLAQNSLS